MTTITDLMSEALLTEMLEGRFVNVTKHPTEGLLIYNYGQRAQFDNMWNDCTLTCRGLITDLDGQIVARPFRKFFNLNQLATIPDGPFVAQEKMDGSLGIIYPASDGPAVATRGSFASEQAIWATAWLRAHPEAVKSAEWAFGQDVTLLVEIVYPDNRIVVDYGSRAELVLLAAIDNLSGDDCRLLEANWPASTAPSYDGLDLDAVMAMEAPNSEGFVLRWENGTRAKVKFAEYLRLHKLLTGVNARTIWELRMNDQPLTEMLELVPDEFYDWVTRTDEQLRAEYAQIEHVAKSDLAATPVADRRTQAEFIKTTRYPGVVFAMLDGKPYAQQVWKMIRPAATAPFKSDGDL